jgi:polyisoprenoid-binding protein YceI
MTQQISVLRTRENREIPVAGTYTIDPTHSHVDVEIQVATLDTGDAQRDASLRSPDFFDVEHYPTIAFRSTKVESGASGTWMVTGDLTVRGVTTWNVALETGGVLVGKKVRIELNVQAVAASRP